MKTIKNRNEQIFNNMKTLIYVAGSFDCIPVDFDFVIECSDSDGLMENFKTKINQFRKENRIHYNEPCLILEKYVVVIPPYEEWLELSGWAGSNRELLQQLEPHTDMRSVYESKNTEYRCRDNFWEHDRELIWYKVVETLYSFREDGFNAIDRTSSYFST